MMIGAQAIHLVASRFLTPGFNGKCTGQHPQAEKGLVMTGLNNPQGSGLGHTPRQDTKASRGMAHGKATYLQYAVG